MKQKPIVVVGSVNIDLVCSAPRIPAPGETVSGDRFQTFHGGKGANQAVAVARLGYPVAMVAKVGDDEFGVRLRKALRDAGVSVRAVTKVPGVSSGVALISTDRQGQNSIVVVPGANGRLLPQDLDRALPLLRSAGMILTQLEIPLVTVEYLAQIASRHRVPLMLDPAPARALPARLLRNVAYLTPNETEACTLCRVNPNGLNRSSVVELARRLRRRGPEVVVVKMGRQGAYLCGSPGDEQFIPAFKVEPLDSTAAGDAFNAALAVGLLEGRRLGQAAHFASAAAALSVTRTGAQPSMPKAREVARFLSQGPKSSDPR